MDVTAEATITEQHTNGDVEQSAGNRLDGHGQLVAELAILDLMLEREVVRLRDSGLYVDNDFRGLYVSDEHVDTLLDGQRRPRLRSARDLALTDAIELRRETLRQAEVDAADAGANLALSHVQTTFGLDDVERALLVVALACDVDLRYEQLFAYAQNDVTRKRPTVELALRLLADDAHGRTRLRTALSAESPLRRHRLLAGPPEDDVDGPLLARPLRAEARVVDAIVGVDSLDERLVPFSRRLRPGPAVDDVLVDDDVARVLPGLRATLRRRSAVVLLRGPYGSGRATLAAALAADIGRPVLAADMRGALREATCKDDRCIGTTFALLAREARLTGAALLLEHFDVLFDDDARSQDRARALAGRLATCGAPVFLAARTDWHPPRPWPDVPFVSITLPAPYPLRVEAWRRALDGVARTGTPPDPSVSPADLASVFAFSPGQVRDTVRDAAHSRRVRGGDTTLYADDLHAAARRQPGHVLARFARRIEPRRSWDDLVVHPKVRRDLRHIELHIRHHAAVSSEWGFDRRLSLADGVTVLFAGPSGTGKTLAAEVLAHELKLELYRVDLSAIVSKYIGETEKQLEQLFETARDANAIVFFDEADATFGKRSEVGDAHDRYANIEVAYLLQKIEEYTGVVILATNLRRNIDEAFARRLDHTVEFSLPRPRERRRILDLLLADHLGPDSDVDLDFVAERFDLTGGNLRNVAVASAFLATDDGGPITMRHVVHATARELEKTGRLPTRSAFGPWFGLLHETLAGD